MAISSRSQRPAAMLFFSFRGGWAQLTMSSFFRGAGPSCGHLIYFFRGEVCRDRPPRKPGISRNQRIYKHFYDSCVPPCIPRQSGHLAGLPCHLFLFAAPDAAGHVIFFISRGPGSAGHVIFFFSRPNIMTWPCHYFPSFQIS